jgi:hypothetical protein
LTTLGFIFELTSSSLEAKLFWDGAQWIGFNFAPIFFLVFALEYTGRKPTQPKRFWGLVSLIPIIYIIVVLTDPFHGMVYTEVWLVPGYPFSTMVYDFTSTVWAISIYTYGLMLAGFWFLISYFFQMPKIYRYQIGIIILGIFIPTIGTLFTFLDLIPTFHRDITPFTFAIGNNFIALGLFRYQLFDLVPVARESVFLA